MNKLIVANWKMNPRTVSEAVRLAKASDRKGAVIAPPFVFLDAVGKVLKHAALGAQNAFLEKEGAWTGEISLGQLKALGARYVILGHSERRKLGETDKLIGGKVAAALKEGSKVVLCIGEDWGVRRKGRRAAYNLIKRQLTEDLRPASRDGSLQTSELLVAYEPIWAIGTGKNDDPVDSGQTSGFIKEMLAAEFSLLGVRVLYGGSVNARNAADFLAQPEIDGVLVGGASLRPAEFRGILKAAE